MIELIWVLREMSKLRVLKTKFVKQLFTKRVALVSEFLTKCLKNIKKTLDITQKKLIKQLTNLKYYNVSSLI